MYQEEASVVFLICYDFKVQKSVFLFFFFPFPLYYRQNSLCYLITHLIYGAPDKKKKRKEKTAGTEVESPARRRFDKLDSAVIDAESTAET